MRSSQGQHIAEMTGRRGLSDLTVQVLGVLITFAVFGALAFGINVLFTSMAAG